jgi:gluconate 5-dehydrogenase
MFQAEGETQMSIPEYLEKLFSLQGKVVLLTGAAGGIGSELARGLAGAGAEMALADLAMPALQAIADELGEGGHFPFVLDVSDMDSIHRCVGDVLFRYGRIDVLINCAGINKREGFLDVEESTYDRIMDVNLKGLYFLSQAVVRESMMKTGGKIINMASYNSTSMLGGVSVYGASKSAVAALTRSMAIEWAKFNIQANAIAPGHILTPLTAVTWANEHRAGYLRERIAAERPGLPAELVGIAILLASGASGYITGDLINVDGGAIAGGKPWQFDTKY